MSGVFDTSMGFEVREGLSGDIKRLKCRFFAELVSKSGFKECQI
jgi:hypothetical protein